MIVGYYDRSGWPITQMEWVHLFEDQDYVCIGFDQVGDFRVSTVWLGLDHSFLGEGPPLIFETMVFGGDDDHQRRYLTEEAARCGHFETVAMIRKKVAND